MKIDVSLRDLMVNARALIGPDGFEDNPEYARGICELIVSFLPGDYDAAYDYVAASLRH